MENSRTSRRAAWLLSACRAARNRYDLSVGESPAQYWNDLPDSRAHRFGKTLETYEHDRSMFWLPLYQMGWIAAFHVRLAIFLSTLGLSRFECMHPSGVDPGERRVRARSVALVGSLSTC
jgi:hypothetical protein